MVEDRIEDLRSGVDDMERGIRSHPEETSKVYFDNRDEVRARAARVFRKGIAEGALRGMQEEDVGLASDFATAASFIMAWYGANKKKEQQKKATFAYSATLAQITKTPMDANAVFLLQAEQGWMSVLPKSRGGCSTVMLMFVIYWLAATGLWAAFQLT